jgi:LacI family transcriptional regulator
MRREPASIKDVAERAGVSVGTVSNVLNRPDVVAAATRERVQRIIAEVGFVRNGSASRLRASRNNAIGLVVIDVGNPFFTEVVRGAEKTAEELGYVVMLCNCDSSPAREERHIRFLEEQRVAGILITPTSLQLARPRLDAVQARGLNVVLVDEPTAQIDRCSVSVDDVLGGEIAGRHLLELGRRRIVYVQSVEPFRQFEDRLVGLRRAVDAHPGGTGVVIDVVRVPRLEGEAVVEGTAEVLRADPDAVFCANDVAALGVLRGLVARGVDVPGDVALIGYDDIGFASMAAVPLSSIRQPAFELGSTAARLLLEECSGNAHTHQHVTFRPTLVARQSTLGGSPTVAPVSAAWTM